MDELRLATRLVAIDSSTADGVHETVSVVASELAALGVACREHDVDGRPCLLARAGSGSTRVILHGHVDVVPGLVGQFQPRVDGGRLVGRGTYDMKAALAAMVLAMGDLVGCDGCAVDLVVVPDEERADPSSNATEALVRAGLTADVVICGEPTDLQVGVQAKGVLMLRATASGIAAHGSTPWLGRNAILEGVDAFRRISSLPFANASSAMFDRPSISLGRIAGGDAVNKVADVCRLDIDIRFLPGQAATDVLEQIAGLCDWDLEVLLKRPAVEVDPAEPYVRALIEAAARTTGGSVAVGRDGASDAVAFIEAGVPAVEFGPVGGGHHGPDEWVDIESLGVYRRTLVDFARGLAAAGRAREGAAA